MHPGTQIYIAGRGCVAVCGFTSHTLGGNVQTVCVSHELKTTSGQGVRRNFVDLKLGAERWSCTPLEVTTGLVSGDTSTTAAVSGSRSLSPVVCCSRPPPSEV